MQDMVEQHMTHLSGAAAMLKIILVKIIDQIEIYIYWVTILFTTFYIHIAWLDSQRKKFELNYYFEHLS